MNLLMVLTISFQALIFGIYDVHAATVVTVTDKEGINIRSGPGTNYSTVAALSYKASVNLVSTTKKSGTGCSGGWYQINYNNSTSRYICSNYVSSPTTSNPTITSGPNYYTTSGWQYRISEDYANVRSSTSASSTKKDTIYMGTTVNVLSSHAANADCSSGWYKISYYNNRTGFVCKSLVEKYEDVTASDAAYNTTLKNAGFPESYWPYLTYLHKLHPKWVFKASNTNKDFTTAIKSEAGKNYIQSTETSYIASSTIKEKPNWRAASNAVIAYFIDPRNYLTEKNIFAFEELKYNRNYQTASVVKGLFGGTYLATDTYANYFVSAGSSYNVSPLHLAARVKKEGGTNANYAAVSGNSGLKYNGTSLNGVYNYYNIGAYGSDPVTRGLAAAKGLVDNYDGTPWNSREKAIKYGAKYIAEGYISQGQNTIYYEKFNTGPGASQPSYTHQYQTNIIAPASESLYMRNAYQGQKILNTAFVFNIPVYKNMPSNYTIHPPIGNTSTELSSIMIDGKNINGFDEDVITYTHYVPSTTKSVSLTATPKVSSSTVSGTGTITTSANTTTAKLKVTSQVGTTKTYTITIIKSASTIDNSTKVEDILNKVDVKYNNSYMSGIVEATTSTTLSNNINKVAPTANVTITDHNKKKKTSKLVTGDIITITNGNSSKTYTIVLKGDINGDGKVDSLDMLKIQKHIKKVYKLSGAASEAADTNYDNGINSLDLLRVQKHIKKVYKLK